MHAIFHWVKFIAMIVYELGYTQLKVNLNCLIVYLAWLHVLMHSVIV